MHRWLARLSYSFFIIAAVLLWEANKLSASQRSRQGAYVVGAAACAVLGILGVKARHRPED